MNLTEEANYEYDKKIFPPTSILNIMVPLYGWNSEKDIEEIKDKIKKTFEILDLEVFKITNKNISSDAIRTFLNHIRKFNNKEKFLVMNSEDKIKYMKMIIGINDIKLTDDEYKIMEKYIIERLNRNSEF